MNHKAEKPFTPKKPKQPKPLQTVKPIKTNTGEIHITNEDVTKKIVISEKQIPILYEYRNEPNLPFEEFGDKEYHKQTYEHFVDYLENIGKYGKLNDKYSNEGSEMLVLQDGMEIKFVWIIIK